MTCNAGWPDLHREEWAPIFAAPVPLGLFATSPAGFRWMSAHWVERDGDAIICVDWSQGALVRSLKEHPEVEFFAQSEGPIGSYGARAELVFDDQLAAAWARKIWPVTPRLSGPSR